MKPVTDNVNRDDASSILPENLPFPNMADRGWVITEMKGQESQAKTNAISELGLLLEGLKIAPMPSMICVKFRGQTTPQKISATMCLH